MTGSRCATAMWCRSRSKASARCGTAWSRRPGAPRSIEGDGPSPKPPTGLRGRATPGAVPYRHTLRIRYGECDMQGIVFNAHYLAYCDDAFGAWVSAGIPGGVTFVGNHGW